MSISTKYIFTRGKTPKKKKKGNKKMSSLANVTIGVMAIQGAVEEHVNAIKRLGCKAKEVRIRN
jgi:hypothetical protein